MKICIRGARVVDPSQSLDRMLDVWISDGLIEKFEPPAERRNSDTSVEIIDGTGAVLAPGFVDLHVHFREPGQEHKEDILSGSRAAVAGGYTSVCCMPNTAPPNDSVEVTRKILARAKEVGLCRVYPVGAISIGLAGKTLAPLEELKSAGCVAFSDDGLPVNDPTLMRKALAEVKRLDSLLIEHCEELSLSGEGLMHEGDTARSLGYAGISVAAETVDASRTLTLAAEIGARIHLAHLSTAAVLELVETFKTTSSGVSCEVTPHHLTLVDEDVTRLGTNGKMYPPLRSRADRDALIKGLASGAIDAVATDHAPHSSDEKRLSFERAPRGVLGVETALSVLLPYVDAQVLSLSDLVARLSTAPARIARLRAGSLAPGMPADLVLFDPDREMVLHNSDLRSKSKNSPFEGFQGKGKVLRTMVQGRTVFSEEAP